MGEILVPDIDGILGHFIERRGTIDKWAMRCVERHLHDHRPIKGPGLALEDVGRGRRRDSEREKKEGFRFHWEKRAPQYPKRSGYPPCVRLSHAAVVSTASASSTGRDSLRSGKEMVTIVPFPRLLCTVTVPSCVCMIDFTIDKPRPVPVALRAAFAR